MLAEKQASCIYCYDLELAVYIVMAWNWGIEWVEELVLQQMNLHLEMITSPVLVVAKNMNMCTMNLCTATSWCSSFQLMIDK